MGSYMLSDKTRAVDMDLSGPVLVPADASGVRTSFMIETGNPRGQRSQRSRLKTRLGCEQRSTNK